MATRPPAVPELERWLDGPTIRNRRHPTHVRPRSKRNMEFPIDSKRQSRSGALRRNGYRSRPVASVNGGAFRPEKQANFSVKIQGTAADLASSAIIGVNGKAVGASAGDWLRFLRQLLIVHGRQLPMSGSESGRFSLEMRIAGRGCAAAYCRRRGEGQAAGQKAWLWQVAGAVPRSRARRQLRSLHQPRDTPCGMESLWRLTDAAPMRPVRCAYSVRTDSDRGGR